MLGIIRFIGVTNAAVWLGASVFFTLAAGPAFFSAEMLSFLPRPHAGRAAEVVIGRLFTLQQVCGVVAVVHLVAEYLYAGRPIRRWGGLVVGALLAVSLLGGFWLQPKMHELQRVRYGVQSTAAEADRAARTFGMWHGIAQVVNLFVLAGLGVFFWQTVHPADVPHYPPWKKIRS